MKTGVLLWEGLTVAVVVLGAGSIFFLRRWLTDTPWETPPGFWLRFSALLCGFCLLGLIGGVMLASYGFEWFLLVLGVALWVLAKILPKLLNP